MIGSKPIQQVLVHAFGGPEQLVVQETDKTLHASPGGLLVDVEAAGVNYLDVMHRKGIGSMKLPIRPGLEGVGRIREIGEGADRHQLSLRR